MEIHFQNHKTNRTKQTLITKTKANFKEPKTRPANKFIGVRQRPSGRWVAEIKDTTQDIRMWLGTYETAEEAARAYDQAACLLRGTHTRTNFSTRVDTDSPLASRVRSLLNKKKKKSDQENVTSSPRNPSFSSSSSCSSSWCSEVGVDVFEYTQEAAVVDTPESENGELSEFERMKVERQFSASLYAMNGVEERIMEAAAVDDNRRSYDDLLWDLPPLCSLTSLLYY